MVPGYRQLSRGSADLRYNIIDLDGVVLLWGENRVHSLWRDEMLAGSGFQFGFVVEADDKVIAHGHEVGPDHALIWMPGEEMVNVTKGRTSTLEIGLSEDLVEALGWCLNGPVLSQVPARRLQRLARVCRAASLTNVSIEDRRGCVLEALENAISPWTDATLARIHPGLMDAVNWKIVDKADRLLDRMRDDLPDAGGVAESLGVSRRTLFYAFRKSLGIGPRRYFEIQRLYRLRAQLCAGSPETLTVTSAATELGFGDLGRLASSYREQFGELPSVTLSSQTH